MKNKNMHIAFIDFDSIHNPLLSGGQARATFEVSKRLVDSGHRVTILCSRYPGSRNRNYKGIRYVHIGWGTKNILINNIGFFLSIPFALRKLTADVIIECFMAPTSTSFAPLFTKTPVVGMPTMFEAEQFAKKYHFPFHKIEAFGCSFYKYFLAYSPINKAKMEKYSPQVISRVIPNGVSEDFFKVKTTKGDYIFFIGRIDFFQKGLDLLLEAAARVARKHSFNLVLAGNGPEAEEARLREVIKAKGLESTVEFIGRVDGKEKTSLIANCYAGTYPSRFEDFPLVPLEFASMGKPLICYDIPGLKWVPATVAAKAKPFQVKSLEQAITKMLTDKAYHTKLASSATGFARPYGWNGIAKQYEQFCSDIIDMEQARKLLQAKKGAMA
jgi:glycosyltransferase involved in cell wall biosynthesis